MLPTFNGAIGGGGDGQQSSRSGGGSSEGDGGGGRAKLSLIGELWMVGNGGGDGDLSLSR